MKHIISCLLLIFVTSYFALGQQTNSQNYIIQRTYKQSGADANDVSKVITQVQYLDGLGRPLQSVAVKQSPAGSDLVQPIEYDNMGRQSKEYLLYVANGNGAYQSTATSAILTWYTANTALLKSSDLSRPFTETFFEASPLNRPSGQRAPGSKSASSQAVYKVNSGSEVKRYDYSGDITENGNYGAGKLFVVEKTDENGSVILQYTDLLGQVVCKKVIVSETEELTTYYVYDDNGWLRGVLQPQYQDDPDLEKFAFLYDYDSRGRVTTKRVPGVGITEIVYDKFDRPVVSRDPNQKARGAWAFTKYDFLNRAILTGEISSDKSRSEWQTKYDDVTVHHENNLGNTGLGYTLNLTSVESADGFPQIEDANVLTITNYDNYSFPGSSISTLAYNSTSGYYPTTNSSVKTQITATKARMLPGNGSAGELLTSIIYYDNEYRPIQTARQLYDLGANAFERLSILYKYDLAPVISEQKTEQVLSGSVTDSHLTVNTYDHADRLLSVQEKVVNGIYTKEVYTVAQRYNTLGQLLTKWQHSTDNVKYRHRTTYTNNIRGWLTDAKTSYKNTVSGPEYSVFAFGMEYFKSDGNYTNGNISQTEWMGKDQTAYSAGLTYNYDKANRLTGSDGKTYGGVKYADYEAGISYDKNGNLLTLLRSGASTDNLTYTYGSGNRLSNLIDASNVANTAVKNGTSVYEYDANGNMTFDGNRNANISYNHLNLPMTVSIGANTQTYDYDAFGEKRKYVADSLTLKYSGGFEYKSSGTANTFYRVGLNDAQAVYRGSALKFEYYVKDHLGNVRVVFDEDGSIIQKSDYYPFGLTVSRNSNQTQSSRNAINRYLYNGKEIQTETGYLDYGARMYMPEIGKWGAVDPLAEKYYSFSPYIYSTNDPVLFGDLDGRDIDVSRFNSKDNLTVLRQFLATELGRSFFRQFARKGDVIGGVRFAQDGARVKDLLVIQSLGNDANMRTDVGRSDVYERVDPNLNKTRPGSIYGKHIQFADKSTNGESGFIYMIRMEDYMGVAAKLNTLSHESFVHIQDDVNTLSQLSDRNIKPGSSIYIEVLRNAGASGYRDHEKLGKGLVENYKNIAAQLDKLNNTSIFSSLYNQNVLDHQNEK